MKACRLRGKIPKHNGRYLTMADVRMIYRSPVTSADIAASRYTGTKPRTIYAATTTCETLKIAEKQDIFEQKMFGNEKKISVALNKTALNSYTETKSR